MWSLNTFTQVIYIYERKETRNYCLLFLYHGINSRYLLMSEAICGMNFTSETSVCKWFNYLDSILCNIYSCLLPSILSFIWHKRWWLTYDKILHCIVCVIIMSDHENKTNLKKMTKYCIQYEWRVVLWCSLDLKKLYSFLIFCSTFICF